MFENKNILIIVPHQDDEAFGCLGLILKYQNKANFYICYCGDRKGYIKKEKILNQKNKEFLSFIKKINFKKKYFLNIQSSKFYKQDKTIFIDKINKVIENCKPDIIISNHSGDVHSDHKILAECLEPFSKSFRYPKIKTLLTMEIISETNLGSGKIFRPFIPTLYIDISKEINNKIKLINLYKSELIKNTRDTDLVLSLSKIRGAEVMLKNAEAFMVLKHII